MIINYWNTLHEYKLGFSLVSLVWNRRLYWKQEERGNSECMTSFIRQQNESKWVILKILAA